MNNEGFYRGTKHNKITQPLSKDSPLLLSDKKKPWERGWKKTVPTYSELQAFKVTLFVTYCCDYTDHMNLSPDQ